MRRFTLALPLLPLMGALSGALCGACSETVKKTISIVRITPAVDSTCGAPSDARSMVVRALGDFGGGEGSAQSVELGMNGEFSIDRFPDDTRMLEVEVRGFGGALRAVGRSLEFSLSDLEDGDELPIFMAPRQGVCPVGAAISARNRPMLARSGDAVLMAGGTDESGAPVLTMERYEPRSASFVQLDGDLYADTSPLGLQGASMTELSGGDVVIVGGAATAYQLYLSADAALSSPSFYREARAYHAAVALPDNQIFLAAGCSQPVLVGCAIGSALLTSSILDPATGNLNAGPALQQARIGGKAWLEPGGSIVLVGGVDGSSQPVTVAERIFLDGRNSELIAQFGGSSAMAASGTLWAGLAQAGQAPSSELSVLPPGSASASAASSATFADSDAQLVALEDGSFLALGQGGAQRIRSFDGGGASLELSPLAGRDGQSAIRLADGSVLIVGGGAGAVSPDAFVYRPALAGPLSASSSVSFFSEDLSEGLSARNPNRVEVVSEEGDHAEISLGTEAEEWLIVAAPHFANFNMEVGLATDAASALVYFAWQSASNHWKVVLSGGTVPSLMQVVDGVSTDAGECQGVALGSLSFADRQDRVHDLRVDLRSDTLSVSLNGAEVLSCVLDQLPARGQGGVGVFGTIGQELRIDLISLGR